MNNEIKSAIINRRKIQHILINHLIVLNGNSNTVRNNDCNYPFRQNSDFLYLTGIDIPGCILIITPLEDFLFIPKIDKKMIIWNGETDSIKIIKQKYNFKNVLFLDRFEKTLTKLTKKYSKIYSNRSLEILKGLRLIKNDHEIKILKQISQITSIAFIETIKKFHLCMHEYQLQSIFEHELFFNNIRNTSFQTIIASGTNSSILHYTGNNNFLNKNDLCLLDAGGELFGYAADITRTFPVSGKFSQKQKDIYNIVLSSQIQAIEAIKPGLKMIDIHNIAALVICQGLKDLKILSGSVEEIINKKTYRLFFPHGLSHLMGIDVHDVCPKSKILKKTNTQDLRTNFILEQNQVLTVEPGIYFNKYILNNKQIRAKHKNTVNWKLVETYLNFGGIRIEDDILITDNGFLVLTNVPKSVIEIESLMAGNPKIGS